MSIELIGAILGSSVVSALITQLFLKWKSDKQVTIENVTQERKEWRIRIRELLIEFTDAFNEQDVKLAKKVESELIVRLNPEDPDDMDILNMFPELYKEWSDESRLEFSDKLAYLLKHDWERVKVEVSGGFTIYKFFTVLVFSSLTVALFFGVYGEDFIAEQLSIFQLSLYFCGWLVGSTGVACIIDFWIQKSFMKKKVSNILGYSRRSSYIKRSERNNS
ncbi:hypothetical protein ACEWAY_22675 [Vibrio parahaemolyticus]